MSVAIFLTAPQIHDGQKWLPEGTVVELTEKGKIKEIHSRGIIPPERVQQLDGILCPGFINAHGHLELSHLKQKIDSGSGLTDFLLAVMNNRAAVSEEEKEEAILEAIRQQKEKGIVAIGDIANGTDSLKYRPDAALHIHTFVECMGLVPQNAADRFRYSEAVYRQFAAQASDDYYLGQSIVPHAPYSVAQNLFQLIARHQPEALISIHNQETEAEGELYQQKSGPLLRLFAELGINPEVFSASGKSSLQTYFPWLAGNHPLLLVHNTFTTPSDIDFLQQSGSAFSFCLCPAANMYIENRLPDLEMLCQKQVPICIGTDSLASNHQLDILAELNILQEYYSHLDWEQMLCWACFNGAKALQLEDRLGHLRPGLQPGIVQLQFSGDTRLVKNARVKVLFGSANP